MNENLTVTTTAQSLRQLIDTIGLRAEYDAAIDGGVAPAVLLQNNGTEEIWMSSVGTAQAGHGVSIQPGNKVSFNDCDMLDDHTFIVGSGAGLLGITAA